MNQRINFQNKLELFSEHWSPKVIAEMNDYQFKLAKIKGKLTWHDHADNDVYHADSQVADFKALQCCFQHLDVVLAESVQHRLHFLEDQAHVFAGIFISERIFPSN